MEQDHVLILAAGRGTRAGGPKALMSIGKTPWWRIQSDRLERAALPALWVVSEHVRTAMHGDARAPKHTIMADDGAPMFSSILAGLQALDQQHLSRHAEPIRGVFILPIDVPIPDRRTFDALSRAANTPAHHAAAIPSHNGVHGHPVYLRWEFVRSRILGIAHTPDDRLDRLIGASRIEITVEDPSVAANLNTREDFDHWASAQWR